MKQLRSSLRGTHTDLCTRHSHDGPMSFLLWTSTRGCLTQMTSYYAHDHALTGWGDYTWFSICWLFFMFPEKTLRDEDLTLGIRVHGGNILSMARVRYLECWQHCGDSDYKILHRLRKIYVIIHRITSLFRLVESTLRVTRVNVRCPLNNIDLAKTAEWLNHYTVNFTYENAQVMSLVHRDSLEPRPGLCQSAGTRTTAWQASLSRPHALSSRPPMFLECLFGDWTWKGPSYGKFV